MTLLLASTIKVSDLEHFKGGAEVASSLSAGDNILIILGDINDDASMKKVIKRKPKSTIGVISTVGAFFPLGVKSAIVLSGFNIERDPIGSDKMCFQKDMSIRRDAGKENNGVCV